MDSPKDHLQAEKELINLLLRHKNAVADWVDSNLVSTCFDSSFRHVLRAIEDAFEDDVLLTRRSYLSFLEKYKFSKQEAIAEEMVYNGIHMLNAKLDDYPMLKEKILDSYLFRSSVEHLRKFSPTREKKGNLFAITQLSEQLQDLLAGSDVSRKKVFFGSVEDHASDFYQDLLDIRSGKVKDADPLICNIKEIDYAMTVGFAPGTLTLLCGDVGSYKTTSMLNIGLNVWKVQKKNVLFVPLEMSLQEMYQKLISRETRIPFDKIVRPKSLTDDEMKKLKDEQESWRELSHKFFIMEEAERTKVSVIRRQIEKHLDQFKPDLVVIDYIANLIPDSQRKDRNDLEIGDMLKDLRQMGKKHGFGILSAAQLGREALKRIRRQEGDKVIAYSEDLRGSHEYSADADFVFALLPDPQQPDSLLHLVVVKSRFGKKVFQDGRKKAALEVRPEISLIKSREDILLNVDTNEILQKTQDDTLDFDIGKSDSKEEVVAQDNMFDA